MLTANRIGEHAVFTPLGASNHTQNVRDLDDYYATDPIALESLLKEERFGDVVWECACGNGNLSKVLEKHGYKVFSTDIADHGYGTSGVDFLKVQAPFDGDIITNPPYKYAPEFVRHAIELVPEGHRVAMFLRLQFLEGKARRKLFEAYPPKYVYVSTSRVYCYKGGDINKGKSNGSALAHAWFIWEKSFKGEPTVRWFN